MHDIITFGSATQDIYLESKKFFPITDKKFGEGKSLCFNFGSKIELENAMFFSGGGGTNTAATFAKQGLRVSYCGMLGDDCFGQSIINELNGLKIGTSLIQKKKAEKTNISLVLNYPGQDKTILIYRGASDKLEANNIPWGKIKDTKWFYLAPFSGNLAGLTEKLVNFAKENKIKVAFNPGYNQLILPNLKNILKKIDILILNKKEASLVAKIPYSKEKEIFKKMDEFIPGICIMTKGKEGVTVSDGKFLYRADSISKKVIDTTGAGDSFGSGFVSGFIKTNDIVYAIQLGMANSAANLEKFGAKDGLLRKSEKFKKVNVLKESCANNICKK
jgi:sugar/nucleoside kinase (ribokinase family)